MTAKKYVYCCCFVLNSKQVFGLLLLTFTKWIYSLNKFLLLMWSLFAAFVLVTENWGHFTQCCLCLWTHITTAVIGIFIISSFISSLYATCTWKVCSQSHSSVKVSLWHLVILSWQHDFLFSTNTWLAWIGLCLKDNYMLHILSSQTASIAEVFINSSFDGLQTVYLTQHQYQDHDTIW